MLRDEILQTRLNRWFNDSKEYALNNYALCSEWLSEYVQNSDLDFVHDFFSPEEAEDVETMRLQALAWIDQNADNIINFDDFRGND
jgi:predicted solute-binding protein